MDWLDNEYGQAVAIVVSLVLIAAYEWHLRRSGVRAPMRTARSAHAEIRRLWVASVVDRPGAEILVVQTLRNSIMAASFMASTAVLALTGTLTLSGLGSSGARLWHGGVQMPVDVMLVDIKLLLLTTSFFLSFLLTSMAVRFFNHAGYLITAHMPPERQAARRDLAAAYLNRAGHHYSLGLRAFFCCVPFLAGLINSVLLLPATVLLLAVLYTFDQVPGAIE